MMVLLEHFDEFVEALRSQLESDNERWGDTFLKRPRTGQEGRTRKSYDDKFDQFENAGVPVPWLKICGDAYIAWLRENHPEMSEHWELSDEDS